MLFFFFFSSRRRHTRWTGDWSSDVCSSDLLRVGGRDEQRHYLGARFEDCPLGEQRGRGGARKRQRGRQAQKTILKGHIPSLPHRRPSRLRTIGAFRKLSMPSLNIGRLSKNCGLDRSDIEQ